MASPSATPTRPLVALSSDGKTLACVPTSVGGESGATILRVLLFQVESGILQTTLTHRNRPDDASVLSRPLKIFFVGPELLVVLFSDQLLAWDLNRGVVAYKIKGKSSQLFHDGCIASDSKNGSSLYILVSADESGKVQIHQYSASDGKMERKVKAGKGGGACGLGANAEYLIVRHEDSVRVLSQGDGQKVSKCSSLNEKNAGDQNIAIAKNIIATISRGQIVLIDAKTGKKLSSIPLDKTTTTSARASFELWKQNESSLILVEGEKVYQIAVSSGQVEKTWTCSLDGSLERQFRLGSGNLLVALLLKNGNYQVVSKALNSADEKIELSWKTPEDTKKEKDEQKQAQKRKQQAAVLGPAQAGGEALISEGPMSKKSKMEMDLEDKEDDGEESPTVGERLQLLQQALDEEELEDDDDGHAMGLEHDLPAAAGFTPKKATTESLGKILEQGLQSGEDRLVELALAVRDERILMETCEELSDNLLPGLLNALTSRLAAKGSRAEHLSIWVSVLLRTGRVRSIAHLQPLRNLIQERIEVFPDLLQLEGRLSLMTRTD